MLNIKIEMTKNPKNKPNEDSLGFGKYFTDHMFLMDYTRGTGWHDARIVPYGPLSLDPAAMVLHYAQETFEGMKAYRTSGGKIQFFRPNENIRRLNRSNERVCIPQIDENDFLQALNAVVKLDEAWIPSAPGTALYIRPFVIATDAHLGVRASDTYTFAIILSPVGAYYAEGINPVKIYVEDEDVRAVRGGTGFAKVGANYSATIRAQHRANDRGYTQVLWLDGVERKYIEEVGTMNVFFKIGDEVITPPLEGSILPGITRMSCIEMLKSWGVKVTERKITVTELFDAAESGALCEAFGSGTAAVISPIGELSWETRKSEINGGKIGALTQKLYDSITGIQWGNAPDTFGWVVPLEK
ncbi:MAG: branched-chain amino acid aminotransferase [Clostridia bacterium]